MDFLNLRSPTLSLNSQFEKMNSELCSNHDMQINNHKDIFDESGDSNLTLDLFKSHRFDNGPRKPSFLEQSLFPRFSPNISPCDKEVKAQLTIFYRGEISVYNDVPYEKAQAIMLLAGESSLSTSVVKNNHNQQNLPSPSELQTDLPIARKFSLKRFLEKRRERLSSKAPYPSPRTTNDDRDNNEKLQICPLVLSPFPSCLGNFLPSQNN